MLTLPGYPEERAAARPPQGVDRQGRFRPVRDSPRPRLPRQRRLGIAGGNPAFLLCPRLLFHSPGGIPTGDRSAPFASFQEGSGRETQGSCRSPGKRGGKLPRRSKRSPFGGRAGKGRSSGRSEPAPFGQRRGTGSLRRRRPSRNVSLEIRGCISSLRKEYTPQAAGLRPLAALPPIRAEIPPSPPEAVLSFHRMV